MNFQLMYIFNGPRKMCPSLFPLSLFDPSDVAKGDRAVKKNFAKNTEIDQENIFCLKVVKLGN